MPLIPFPLFQCNKRISASANNMKMVYNNQEMALPFDSPLLHLYPVSYEKSSPFMLKMETKLDWSLTWDGKSRVMLKVGSSLQGQIYGLVGTFDNKQENDFMGPEVRNEELSRRGGVCPSVRPSVHP